MECVLSLSYGSWFPTYYPLALCVCARVSSPLLCCMPFKYFHLDTRVVLEGRGSGWISIHSMWALSILLCVCVRVCQVIYPPYF